MDQLCTVCTGHNNGTVESDWTKTHRPDWGHRKETHLGRRATGSGGEKGENPLLQKQVRQTRYISRNMDVNIRRNHKKVEKCGAQSWREVQRTGGCIWPFQFRLSHLHIYIYIYTHTYIYILYIYTHTIQIKNTYTEKNSKKNSFPKRKPVTRKIFPSDNQATDLNLHVALWLMQLKFCRFDDSIKMCLWVTWLPCSFWLRPITRDYRIIIHFWVY